MLLIGLLHELGHANALTFFGERPGRIGIAFYILSPIMFSDVTNTWKLTRKERVIVDYGGVFFQGIFSGVLFLINLIWIHSSTLEIVAVSEAIYILGNFNPFFKYDGYWMLSDILGSTNVIQTVMDFWKGIFRFRRNNCDIQRLSFKLIIIILLYSICSLVFLVYFVFLSFGAIFNALDLIYSDIRFALSHEIVYNVPNILMFPLI